MVAVAFLASFVVSCAAVPPNGVPAAGPRPPSPLIEWNAATGTIRCRSTTITVPEPLRGSVRRTTADEVTLVPPWSPPGGALVVTSLAATDPTDAAAFLRELPAVWARLHRLAGGGEMNAANADANIIWQRGRIVAHYALKDRSSAGGKLVYFQAARCRIAALDFAGSPTSAALTELLDGLGGGHGVRDRAARAALVTPRRRREPN